jgi:hypothetical protein
MPPGPTVTVAPLHRFVRLQCPRDATIKGLANHSDCHVPELPLRRLIRRHLELDRLERASVPVHLVCFDGLLVGARLESDLVRYADAAELIVPSAANPERVQPTDFGNAESLIGAAFRAASAALQPPHAAWPVAA